MTAELYAAILQHRWEEARKLIAAGGLTEGELQSLLRKRVST